jgi:hypothetical protein
MPEDFAYPTVFIEQIGTHNCRATLDNGSEKTIAIPCQDGIAVIGDTGVYSKTATGYAHTDLELNTTNMSSTEILGDLFYFENNVYAVTSSGIVVLNGTNANLVQTATGSLKIMNESSFIVEGSSGAVFYRGSITKLSGNLSSSNIDVTQRTEDSRITTYTTPSETLVVEHLLISSGHETVHTSSSTKLPVGFSSKVQASKIDNGIYTLVGEQSGTINAITADTSAVRLTTSLGSGTILGGFAGGNGIVVAIKVEGLLTLKTIGGGVESHVIDHEFLTFPEATGWVHVHTAYSGYGSVAFQTAGGYDLHIIGAH